MVTKDVLPFSLVGGVPATSLGWMSRTGIRLHFENDLNARATCEETGEVYEIKANQVKLINY